MSSAAAPLAEPRVLAHAKRRLFPEAGASEGGGARTDAVVDTQFATERGAEPNRLDPTEDVWALRNPV
jgi:hypothetical protein